MEPVAFLLCREDPLETTIGFKLDTIQQQNLRADGFKNGKFPPLNFFSIWRKDSDEDELKEFDIVIYHQESDQKLLVSHAAVHFEGAFRFTTVKHLLGDGITTPSQVVGTYRFFLIFGDRSIEVWQFSVVS